jgi:hypothetical protein
MIHTSTTQPEQKMPNANETLLKQYRSQSFHQAAALAELAALAEGDMPIHHDAEFLRGEIARVITACRESINQERAMYEREL